MTRATTRSSSAPARPALRGLRLAAAGMKVAVVERKVFGGHLRQHRLHSDQDDGGERLRGARRRARRRVRRRDRGPVRVDMKR